MTVFAGTKEFNSDGATPQNSKSRDVSPVSFSEICAASPEPRRFFPGLHRANNDFIARD
jgi:hypothetical protein